MTKRITFTKKKTVPALKKNTLRKINNGKSMIARDGNVKKSIC